MIIYTGTIGMGGTAQIFIPVIGALFWKRSNGKAAAVGVTAGILTLLLFTILTDFNVSYSAVIAMLVNAGVFIAGSLTFEAESKTREKIVKYKEMYGKNV